MTRENALAIAALLALGALLSTWLARRVRALRLRVRRSRAARGEREAEHLLRAAGWEIEGRQISRVLHFEIDGAPAEAHVRCDLLVRRRARRCVAEVKTGALAPRLDHAPTRRQLLEYRLAFDVDGVLLVDAEAGQVREVVFPLAMRPERARWPLFALGLVIGGALSALALVR